MKREWAPGDLAAITEYGGSIPAVRVSSVECGHVHACVRDHWHYLQRAADGGTWTSNGDVSARPLTVIDAEDREQVERLLAMFDRHFGTDFENSSGRTLMQAALREYANPTPPKPDEPTGLGPIVRADWRDNDGKGFGPCDWARAHTGDWVCLTDGYVGTKTAWQFLQNVEVVQ